MTEPNDDRVPGEDRGPGLFAAATFSTTCPDCGAAMVKEGSPGGLWECGQCGHRKELPPFPPLPDTRGPRRDLLFPEDEIVGTLAWPGSSTADGCPVLATGTVSVPVGAKISLQVRRLEGVERRGDFWTLRGRGGPVNLGVLDALPPDSIDSLTIMQGVASGSTRVLPHLATGLRKLTLANAGLTDASLGHIAQLTGLVALQTFGNSFTDAGVQRLVDLRNIEHLYLEEATLSIDALHFVSRLPRLVRLGLQDLHISDDELASLKGRLANVAVSR